MKEHRRPRETKKRGGPKKSGGQAPVCGVRSYVPMGSPPPPGKTSVPLREQSQWEVNSSFRPQHSHDTIGDKTSVQGRALAEVVLS